MRRRVRLRCLLLAMRLAWLIVYGIRLNRWLIERLREYLAWLERKYDEIVLGKENM